MDNPAGRVGVPFIIPRNEGRIFNRHFFLGGDILIYGFTLFPCSRIKGGKRSPDINLNLCLWVKVSMFFPIVQAGN